jgi:hypothetical protein
MQPKKVLHLGASLQQPIIETKKPRVLQMEEEIMTLLTPKLIALTRFQWRRREKKMWGRQKSKKFIVRTWNLTLIWKP